MKYIQFYYLHEWDKIFIHQIGCLYITFKLKRQFLIGKLEYLILNEQQEL